MISNDNRAGSMSESSTVLAIVVARCGSDSSAADRLMLVTNRPHSGYSRCQRAAVRHTSARTHSPIGRISPESSATGRKSDGASSPRLGCSHRRSASKPASAPVRNDTTGW